MALSDEDVRHVGRLARIGLTDAEVAELRGELSDILDYAARVGEVATEEVPRTGHALRLSNVLRQDTPQPSLDAERALAGAPEAEDGRFRVPRIVEEGGAGPEEPGVAGPEEYSRGGS